MHSTATRLNGLDTLRAAAIALVFMYHYMVFVSHVETFGVLSNIGWVGVDLFFVLSGYLIGNQILSAIAQGRQFSLKTFYIKRCLRTLPNYYVVLALYFLFPLAMGGTTPPSLWKFLSFTQNYQLHAGTAFSQAWSLCVEEQFYLVLPVAALLVAGCRKSLLLGWTLIAATVLAGIAIRDMLWRDYGGDANGYYTHIYYSSFCRFDELLPGVAIAMLKNFHADAYGRLMKKGNLMLTAGVLGAAITFYLYLNYQYVDDNSYGFLMTAFGYPMLTASFALLTLSALSPASLLHRIRVPGACQLALWSYAIYLVHKPLMNMAKGPLSNVGIAADSGLGVMIMLGVSLAGGWLLYRLVETPCMKLRDRLYKQRLSDRPNLLGPAI
ncbi:acyltransferase family protein [Paraherbaspirillum soli]|uniref:Acyltransferase family protein n=1 Tax=Paraherbaspirillum soli TaxID=631222 RepID=A0ABW0M697_9BURK